MLEYFVYGVSIAIVAFFSYQRGYSVGATDTLHAATATILKMANNAVDGTVRLVYNKNEDGLIELYDDGELVSTGTDVTDMVYGLQDLYGDKKIVVVKDMSDTDD